MVRGPASAPALSRMPRVESASTIVREPACVLSVFLFMAVNNADSRSCTPSSFAVTSGDETVATVAVGLPPITLSVALSAAIGLPCKVARIFARYSFALSAAYACSSAC